MLKASTTPFVKFPSGNSPLQLCTSGDSRVFGWLWPTLFPYGVGTIDNDGIRLSLNLGFHKVPTATHVNHLLTIADRCFQTHKSFIFVMHNIILWRRSSFNSRLAVPCHESLIMVDKCSMHMIKLDNPLPGDYHIHVCFIYHCRALTHSLMTARSFL